MRQQTTYPPTCAIGIDLGCTDGCHERADSGEQRVETFAASSLSTCRGEMSYKVRVRRGVGDAM